MKGITLTLILTVVSALTSPLLQDVEDEIVPAFDGIQDTVFLVFTRRNPIVGQIVHIVDMNYIRNSFFDSRLLTKFLVHGFTGNRNSSINTIVVPAYLQAGDFSNFVISINFYSLLKLIVFQMLLSSIGVQVNFVN